MRQAWMVFAASSLLEKEQHLLLSVIMHACMHAYASRFITKFADRSRSQSWSSQNHFYIWEYLRTCSVSVRNIVLDISSLHGGK